MPIELKCPQCAASLTIPDGSGGRQTRCPSCAAIFTAPASSDASAATADAPRERPSVDASNPYAPTFTSSTVAEVAFSDWAPRQITYDEVFSKTWAIFKEQWLMTCVAVLIVFGINIGLNIAQSVVTQLVAAAGEQGWVVLATQFLMGAGRWLLQMWITIGQTMVMFDIARGREVKLGKIFGGGPLLVKTVLAVILVGSGLGGIAAVLVGLPALIVGLVTQEPGAAAIAAVVGAVIAAIPILIGILMFSQVQVLIVDRALGPVEAARTSYEITNGNKLTLFVIMILMSVVGMLAAIAGLLALCVGIIPAMIGVSAFGALLLVVAYLCMTGQQVVAQRTYVSPSPEFGS